MNGLLQKSMEEHIPVEMIYMSSTNQITQRKIIVTNINGTTIRAFCYMRKQTRLFKVSRILSLMPIKKPRREIS